jgi:hypothetical protein
MKPLRDTFSRDNGEFPLHEVTDAVHYLKQIWRIGSSKGYDLSTSMNTGISASGGVQGAYLLPTHNRERLLKFRLYGFKIWLLLPSVEAAAIVLNYELYVLHGGKFLLGA